ncbi:MAG: hypothetical protein QF364_00880 [Candidatus Poseidoniaceae archaeon]|nr:hypothetical protein [Candidatus Poseidoniaceae archaeon]
MDVCESCGSLMLMGWVACPYCGWQNDMLMNSNRSLVELVQMNSDRETIGGCSGSCLGSCSGKKKKKMKSKCCNKHKKKSKKHCKRCPERRVSELSTSVSSNVGF